MKKKNPLGLRVLSTAAVMSIITSIAAPAFAGTYYMDNGDVNVEVKENGDVYVNGQKDEDGEVTIKGGSGTNTWSNKSSTNAEKQKTEEPQEEPSIGESYPVEEKTEEEPAAEQPEPEEETKEQPEEPENPAEDEQPEPEAPAAEEKTPAEDAAEPEETEGPETKAPAAEETVEEADTEEPADEAAEETEDTEKPEDETPAEDAGQPAEAAEDETAPAEQEAVTLEAAGANPVVQAEDETPAETPHTISIKNDWKTNLKIILDNVRIKASGSNAAMSVTGKESTTVELDGANVLDSSGTSGHAGLEKSGDGTLTITDTDGTTDNDGSLTATGGAYGAGIGGKNGSNGEHITIEGNAKVTAAGGNDAAGIGGGSVGDGRDITIQGNADVKAAARGYGAGIGGGIMDTSGHGGNADKIVIRGNAKVNASSVNGAGIGSGGAAFGGQANATGIVIRDHAEVTAEATGYGYSSGIGVGSRIYNAKTDITIGTEGATSADEDVHVTAKSRSGSAIGGGTSGDTADTTVTIQGNATIEEAKSQAESSSNVWAKAAIGGTSGTVNVTIRDNAKIKKVDHTNKSGKAFEIAIGGGSKTTKVIVNILGHAHLESVLGDIEGGKNAIINIKDHAAIDSIRVDSGWAIGGWVGSGNSSIVNIDGGSDGNVRIGEVGGICGNNSGIKGTSVNIGDHVKLWLKQGNGTNSTYVEVDRKEVDIGSTQKPEKGGLINTIGSDTEIWYTDKDGTLVQIVHGKNLCVWDEGTVTEQPTCDKPGKKVHHCIYEANKASSPCCDRTWTEVLPATGHSWNEGKVTTAPTCTEAGVKTYTCTTCSKTRTETIPATGHAWVNDGAHVDATCTTDGYQDQKCTNDGCGATQRVWDHPEDTEHKGDGTSHDYSGEEWIITPATCTKDGQKVKHCTRAPGDATHDEVEVIPATGHQHVTEGVGKKDPTCKKPGYTGDTVCDDCHETIKKGEVIPATGHEKTHIEGKKEPTCEEPGYTGDKVCDKCGDVVEKGEVIPVKGHTPTIVGRVEPTETEPGYTGDTVCADCGKLLAKGEVIPATGKKDAENAEAPELRVVAPGNTLRDLLFTVRQAGTERTYTCKKADATLTGTLETLQYLQANGAETIVFVTNGRVSRFAVADLLALCNEGDVFYLCHTADAEPTLLIIANDHTELLNK